MAGTLCGAGHTSGYISETRDQPSYFPDGFLGLTRLYDRTAVSYILLPQAFYVNSKGNTWPRGVPLILKSSSWKCPGIG